MPSLGVWRRFTRSVGGNRWWKTRDFWMVVSNMVPFWAELLSGVRDHLDTNLDANMDMNRFLYFWSYPWKKHWIFHEKNIGFSIIFVTGWCLHVFRLSTEDAFARFGPHSLPTGPSSAGSCPHRHRRSEMPHGRGPWDQPLRLAFEASKLGRVSANSPHKLQTLDAKKNNNDLIFVLLVLCFTFYSYIVLLPAKASCLTLNTRDSSSNAEPTLRPRTLRVFRHTLPDSSDFFKQLTVLEKTQTSRPMVIRCVELCFEPLNTKTYHHIPSYHPQIRTQVEPAHGRAVPLRVGKPPAPVESVFVPWFCL